MIREDLGNAIDSHTYRAPTGYLIIRTCAITISHNPPIALTTAQNHDSLYSHNKTYLFLRISHSVSEEKMDRMSMSPRLLPFRTGSADLGTMWQL